MVLSRTSTSVAWRAFSRPTWQQPASLDVTSCWSCGHSLQAPFKKVTALAASYCCESGVGTTSIGRRCEQSIWRKDCVATAVKTKAKAHLPWGNGSEATRIACVGNAQHATGTPANHINAAFVGCGFRKKPFPWSIEETQTASIVFATPANCVNHVTYVTPKRQKVSTALPHGNPATRTEGFARHAQAPRRQKTAGPAPPVERSCQSWPLRYGAATARPVKMEPRSATNAIAHRRCDASLDGHGGASASTGGRCAAAQLWRRSGKRSAQWSARAAANRSIAKQTYRATATHKRSQA